MHSEQTESHYGELCTLFSVTTDNKLADLRRRVAQNACRPAISSLPELASRGVRVSMLAVGREQSADGGAHEYVHFATRLMADPDEGR